MPENMDTERRKELEANGWKLSGVMDSLGLTVEELEYIEIKINLNEMVREFRERRGLSQADAAKFLKPSQSQLSKIETADWAVADQDTSGIGHY